MKLTNFLRILGVCLALSSYAAWGLSVRDRQRQPSTSAEEIPAAGIGLLDLREAERLWHDPATLFVDVRSAGDYEVGHITGAVSLPEETFAERFPALRARLERARTLIVYCKSVDCGKSLWAALRLRAAGLTQTQIYPHGWNEWYNQGLPRTGLDR